MTRHVFFLFFIATATVSPRDLVPNANSILCILVSLISHRPDLKGTLASDLKGAELDPPPPPSVANLATLSLDLATFQTPLATFFLKALSDKSSDF